MTRPTSADDTFTRPDANSYIVPGTGIAAGPYPGSPPDAPDEARDAKLARYLDAGITAFVDLTDPVDPLEPYAVHLERLASERGIDVHYDRLTIRDMDVCDVAHMTRILDRIDEHLEAGRRVYVHCWGGIGRTGTTVGCWLVRHGSTGDEALEMVQELYGTTPQARRRHYPNSPQTSAQCAMVGAWREER